MSTSAESPRVRPVNVAPAETIVRSGADGILYMESPHALRAYPTRLTDALDRWAVEAPDRVFLAQREQPLADAVGAPGAAGAWKTLTYGDARQRVRNVAQALLDRGLSAERPGGTRRSRSSRRRSATS
jgi:feruloyl-CoA synthase